MDADDVVWSPAASLLSPTYLPRGFDSLCYETYTAYSYIVCFLVAAERAIIVVAVDAVMMVTSHKDDEVGSVAVACHYFDRMNANHYYYEPRLLAVAAAIVASVIAVHTADLLG